MSGSLRLPDAERVLAYPDKLAAGAEESDAGVECRDVVGPIGSQMAPQMIESLAHCGLEFGEPDAPARRRDARQCLARGMDETAAGGFRRRWPTMAHSTMATAAATMAAMEVLMRPTGS